MAEALSALVAATYKAMKAGWQVSPLARGFASWAERTSRDLRAELGRGEDDPIDPFDLSRHLAIPVAPLSKARIDEGQRRLLLGSASSRR